MDKIIEIFMNILKNFSKNEKKNINNYESKLKENHKHTITRKNETVVEDIISTKKVEHFSVIELKKEIEPMYKFGKRSKQRLDTCHKDIVTIMNEVIKVFDFSVLEGLRTDEKQLEYFETGRSQLDGVKKKSKHQDDGSGVSRAIDIMPYAKGSNAFSGKQKDVRRFYFLAGIVKMAAAQLLAEGKISHTVRWGGDWNSNNLFDDQNFDDLPHFELESV